MEDMSQVVGERERFPWRKRVKNSNGKDLHSKTLWSWRQTGACMRRVWMILMMTFDI